MPTKQPREDLLASNGDSEIVQLDLDGFDIEESDSFWLKKILDSAYGKNLDTSSLVDYIIKHKDIGTVLKKPIVEDDPDYDPEDQVVFAFNTIIDLSSKVAEKYQCIVELRNFVSNMVSKSVDNAKASALKSYLWDTPGVHPCFLVNERFSNLPPKLNMNALASLSEEIKEVYEESDSKPTVYVVYGQYYVKNGKKTYVYSELEELAKYAVHYVDFKCPDSRTDEEKQEEDFGDCFGFVFAFQCQKLAEFLKSVNMF